jgi:hypothetical protein
LPHNRQFKSVLVRQMRTKHQKHQKNKTFLEMLHIGIKVIYSHCVFANQILSLEIEEKFHGSSNIVFRTKQNRMGRIVWTAISGYFIEFFAFLSKLKQLKEGGEFSWKVLFCYRTWKFYTSTCSTRTTFEWFFLLNLFCSLRFTLKIVVIEGSQIKPRSFHKRFMLAVDFYCFSFTSFYDKVRDM